VSQFTFAVFPTNLSGHFSTTAGNTAGMGVCMGDAGVYVFGLMGRFR